ncbi:hypothetical protein C1280_30805 [Gemmata obscuriglobus]|uniref:Uncharacterized protein n=1 Tax=Gemmata obscuriglobus TaxID=114 RepID=A0A2Z3H4L0_9BACT|nr:hypothetical protein C1280_30805 [Gemmata obscuriglobus]
MWCSPGRSSSPSPRGPTPDCWSNSRGTWSRTSGSRILADAFQYVGCESGRVLDHCRGPAPHARGC